MMKKLHLPDPEDTIELHRRELFIRLHDYLLADRNFVNPKMDIELLVTVLGTIPMFLKLLNRLWDGPYSLSQHGEEGE